jgi:hypothetical protein
MMAPEEILASAEPNRRDFLKKVLAGTTFAAPVLASFSMEGLSPEAAWAQAANQCSNMAESPCCDFAALITIELARFAGDHGLLSTIPQQQVRALLIGQLGMALTLMAKGIDQGNGDCTNDEARGQFKRARKALGDFKDLVDALCSGTVAQSLKDEADGFIGGIGDLVNGVCPSV